MPMGQLPVLEGKEGMLCQSGAIIRYLAKQCGIDGKTPWEQAKADMLVSGTFDIVEAVHPQLVAIINNDKSLQMQEWDKFEKKCLANFLKTYSKFLACSKSGWFVEDSFTYADIAVAEILSCLQDCYCDKALDGYDNLKAFTNKVLSLPGIKEYVAKRPKTKF
ncbi:unnamed protein product [Soboliphyme baturini]|uniref:Glutathione transferase n=1 Tax=Soboliphyme baturini TaxID=241478 RepID=A0A183J1V9_9BILA|nr:unnamed protein product [Soboliphyme baturini]